MKKNIAKILSFTLALLLLFCSCNVGGSNDGSTTVATTTGGGEPQVEMKSALLKDFQLVYPDYVSGELKAAVLELNAAVKAILGRSLKIKTDLNAKDEAAFEILVGEVNRPAVSTAKQNLKNIGDYTITTVPTEKGAKLVIIGYDEEMTLTAVAEFIALLQNNGATDTTGTMNTFNSTDNLYSHYQDFELEIGEEVVISQGDKGTIRWGYYQFPTIGFTPDGQIQVSWGVHNDSITEEWTGHSNEFAYSSDGGKTWTPKSITGGKTTIQKDLTMKNGAIFGGFVGVPNIKVDYLSKYTPRVKSMDGLNVYRAADIKELDTAFSVRQIDPGSGSVSTFRSEVVWPDMPVTVYPAQNLVYAVQNQMSITSPDMGAVVIDGDVYFATYARSFTNRFYNGYYSVFVFKSTDSARSWEKIAEIGVDMNSFQEGMEGFDEPSMEVMPDGSVVILMRTGSNRPSYIVRSEDNCKTWSKPEKFDNVGVLPQILTLGCGVSVATYGRDGLFMRATSDLSGKVWQDHIQIKLSPDTMIGSQSCYYTRLLALDKDTFLFVYTDFHYPDADGTPRKTILVREVNVIPKK